MATTQVERMPIFRQWIYAAVAKDVVILDLGSKMDNISCEGRYHLEFYTWSHGNVAKGTAILDLGSKMAAYLDKNSHNY